jgi:aldehyde:ferredoxin oxidoreductase
VVVEGKAPQDNWFILRINGDSAQLLPAGDAHGLGTYATSDLLQEQYGAGSTVISIGQAGEMCLLGAGICVTGEGGQRSNHAARGGLGAVMGSKGLKAIVIDKPIGRTVPFANIELFRNAARTFAQKLINDPKLGSQGSQHLYGTASIVGAVNEMGSFPTRNFSNGNFEGVETLRGEHLREVTLSRGGEAGTAVCPVA